MTRMRYVERAEKAGGENSYKRLVGKPSGWSQSGRIRRSRLKMAIEEVWCWNTEYNRAA